MNEERFESDELTDEQIGNQNLKAAQQHLAAVTPALPETLTPSATKDVGPYSEVSGKKSPYEQLDDEILRLALTGNVTIALQYIAIREKLTTQELKKADQLLTMKVRAALAVGAGVGGVICAILGVIALSLGVTVSWPAIFPGCILIGLALAYNNPDVAKTFFTQLLKRTGK